MDSSPRNEILARRSAPAQQLSLLPESEVPLQFRLDAATRRRGLQHVAELRTLLEQRRAERSAQQQLTPPRRSAGRAA